MPNFLLIYNEALKHYIAQDERTHYSLYKKVNHPIFTTGYFTWFRHKRTEYDDLRILKNALEKHVNNESQAIIILEKHFSEHAWNNHSFNNYLLDEINKNVSMEEWEKFWKKYDKKSMEYYKGILFRGTSASPQIIFKKGFTEGCRSHNLMDYIKDMNGEVGISTTKSFEVAERYALPFINPNRDFFTAPYESYVYIIDYRGDYGIDLSRTLLSQGKTISSKLADRKKEVNIIERIETHDIVGAFYVNRNNEIIWFSNNQYQGDYDFSNVPDHYSEKINIKPGLR